MKIEKKIAIVTGASKGIGLETTRQLLAKGVKVCGWSRSKPDIDHENFLFVETDVTSQESVKESYDKSVSHFGKDIQILVNNAGMGFHGPLEETSNEEWQQMFDTNVHAIFYISKLVIPRMKELDEGHIVNISSIAGLNPVKNMVGYAATKHAVTGISHSMYQELREFGIKVTCIYPGSVQTNFFDDIDAVDAHEHMMRPQDVAKTVVDCVETHANYLPVDIEVRPLRPKGKQNN
ncbi:MAG: SDR family NAD(P)-dependent oxidoreductase [Cyclobacteriaceae bacterium]